jgi:hypothetical protein
MNLDSDKRTSITPKQANQIWRLAHKTKTTLRTDDGRTVDVIVIGDKALERIVPEFSAEKARRLFLEGEQKAAMARREAYIRQSLHGLAIFGEIQSAYSLRRNGEDIIALDANQVEAISKQVQTKPRSSSPRSR